MRFPLDALQHGHDVAQQEQVLSRQQVQQPDKEETLEADVEHTTPEMTPMEALTFVSPLDRVHPLFVWLRLHRLHPLIVEIHTQQAAGDVSQEVLVVKMKSFHVGVTESVDSKWGNKRFLLIFFYFTINPSK